MVVNVVRFHGHNDRNSVRVGPTNFHHCSIETFFEFSKLTNTAELLMTSKQSRLTMPMFPCRPNDSSPKLVIGPEDLTPRIGLIPLLPDS
jgi:hypothetical protein